MKPALFWTLLLLFACGCQVGPQYDPPVVQAPEAWKHSQTNGANPPPVNNWWEVFEDCILNDLEQQAVLNNPNLFAALERVIQARALAKVARADLFPQLNLMPSYSNQIVLSKLFGTSAAASVSSVQLPNFLREHQLAYALPLDLSYQLDLWGLLQSAYQSELYNAQAAEENFRTALLTLTTDLAYSYFRLRTLDAQLDLYQATIKTRQKALEINQSRYEGKIAIYSDVSRAALELTNLEAEYQEAQRQRDVEENLIATLTGQPAPAFYITKNPLKIAPPTIPAGLPSEVLLQRPDVAEAERRMASQNALVRVAYASFFPSISLTGSLGFSSPDLAQFLRWKSRFWMLGVNIAQTVFDGGRKYYDLQYAWSRFREADDEYQQQVLTAFQEVEDALAGIQWYAKEYLKIEQSVTSAKTTYKITHDRYLNGLTFYLDVVNSEQEELVAERNLIILLGQKYSATLQLIKALGGAWSLPDANSGQECPESP